MPDSNSKKKLHVKTKRTTVILPESLDKNLGVYALQNGLSKGKAIEKIFFDFLVGKGLQPDKQPSIQITY